MQGAAANPPPQDKHNWAASVLPPYHLGSSLGMHMPLQQGVTETKQLSQTARSQRRVSLVQQMATKMEKTILGRLFESRGLQKGLEEGEI